MTHKLLSFYLYDGWGGLYNGWCYDCNIANPIENFSSDRMELFMCHKIGIFGI